ncbi:MAG: rhomboid family intramembrane serine protease [Gammaproteobacteria bacterium]|nr:rhomboid family intramembrane serine protease [Gammaproteobacteria bacterium]MBU1645863.1 rhomboid family intramembrane serine protease [Gammaproteobacteria bacterium]MBU1971925.1 rhomboid family intramembrane serine protease [Gammaproteobacteria bacterium]
MLGALVILLVPAFLLGLVWFFVWLTARGQRRAEAAVRRETAARNNDPEPARWFLQAGEREHGPFGLAQLQRFKEQGMVTPDSVLRHTATGQALAAVAVPGLFAPAASAPDYATQTVEFQTFAGHADPLRLGKGSVCMADGALIVHGRRRRLFAFGRSDERIPLLDIHDVIVDGRLVRFRVAGQAAKLPRLLRLATPAAASELAARLPTRLSVDGARAKADAHEFSRFLQESGTPLVTLAIIAANVIMYLVAGAKGAGWMSGNTMVLYDLGGNFAASTALGQWWRLATSMFLHAGLMHVALNMWALWEAGRIAERLFGHGTFAMVYLAAGLLGALASINWQQDFVGVGASGAVFGVYGALLAALALRKDMLPLSVARQMTASMAVFVAYSLLNGFAKTGIDNAAHLGGLLAGALLGAGLVASAQRMWASVAATVALLGMGAARAVEMAEPVRDEPAFRAFLVTFAPAEEQLNAKAKSLFASLKSMPADEFVRRLDTEILKGWQEQNRRIAPLTRLTVRSREVRDPMAQFIHLKTASLEDLREGLARQDETLMLAGKAKLDQANAILAAAKLKADERQNEKGKK